MENRAWIVGSLAAFMLLPLLGCSQAAGTAAEPPAAARGVVIASIVRSRSSAAATKPELYVVVTSAFASNDGHGYVDATLGPTN
ncbi:hypothetical protein BH11MYX4_BH11MYX4_52270 [soil metagenome]